jgi:hypothetical protein
MTTPRPLSSAAQAVFDAFVAEAGPGHRHQREAVAAAIRALVDQVVPEDPCGNDCCITQCERIREDQLAIAAELDGGAPQPTSTETPDEHA